MTRINGSRMIWLNGQQIREAELPGNMSLINDAAGMTQLNIRANGTTYRLKPGQSINLTSSTINEIDQGGQPATDEDGTGNLDNAGGDTALQENAGSTLVTPPAGGDSTALAEKDSTGGDANARREAMTAILQASEGRDQPPPSELLDMLSESVQETGNGNR